MAYEEEDTCMVGGKEPGYFPPTNKCRLIIFSLTHTLEAA